MDDISPYVLLAGFTFVEGGEVALIFAGYLMHTYGLALAPVTLILFSMIMVTDFLWYRFGAHLYRLPIINRLESRLGSMDAQIAKRPFLTMLMVRFSYGLHHVTVARYRGAGIANIHMLKVLAGSSIVWLVVLGGIVATLVKMIPAAKHYVHIFEITLAFVFVGFFLFERLSTVFWRKTLQDADNGTEGTL